MFKKFALVALAAVSLFVVASSAQAKTHNIYQFHLGKQEAEQLRLRARVLDTMLAFVTDDNMSQADQDNLDTVLKAVQKSLDATRDAAGKVLSLREEVKVGIISFKAYNRKAPQMDRMLAQQVSTTLADLNTCIAFVTMLTKE